jgi:hypothetical protein
MDKKDARKLEELFWKDGDDRWKCTLHTLEQIEEMLHSNKRTYPGTDEAHERRTVTGYQKVLSQPNISSTGNPVMNMTLLQ